MTVERRLQRHFEQAARQLPEPPDALADVVRRGRRRQVVRRGLVAAVTVAALAAVPVAVQWRSATTVEFGPGAPPADTEPASPSPTPGTASPTPKPTPSDEPTTRPPLAPDSLGAAVLAYASDGEGLQIFSSGGGGSEVVWPGGVDVALSDGRGGIVVQPAGEEVLLWLPEGDDSAEVKLAEAATGDLQLRAVLPGDRVVYSVRPDVREIGENAVEDFFIVALRRDPQAPELVDQTGAYESWVVGPVVAAGDRLVHASCHLHCTLAEGLADGTEGTQPLYDGFAIEGLTATPDGRVVGFLEHDIAQPDDDLAADHADLVLLDGRSFDELARVEIPMEDRNGFGMPTVSLSGDGQRVLVSLRPWGHDGPVGPATSYLVSDALTEAPDVQRVDVAATLRWLDPSAAGRP